MHKQKIISLFLSTIFVALPATSYAQELCFRSGAAIFGDPIEVSLVWPIDATAPPELLARPENDTLEGLFDDLDPNKTATDCNGGSIVGVLNCDVIAPMMVGDAEASADQGTNVDPQDDETTEAGTAKPSEDTAAPDAPDITKEIGAKIQFRPVYYMTNPPTMGFLHSGFEPNFDPSKLTPEAIARADKDIKTYIAKLTKSQFQLTTEDAAALAFGNKISPSSAFESELSSNAQLHPPKNFALPPACVSLFALRMEKTEQALELDAANRKLKSLEKQKKDYEALPFLDRMADSRTLSKFDTQIKIAKNRLRKAAEAYGNTGKRISAQEQKLNEAEHLAKLNAIGTDPAKIKAADMERTGKAVEAYRAYRLHEKQHAAATEEYRKGLQGFDDKIASAPDESTRIGYQEQRDRYQRAYESWNDQSRMTTASRFRDLAREFKQNDEDGLGPKSFEELTQRIDATGDKPEDVLENYLAEKIDRANRIAKSDVKTLGGTATRAGGTAQFLKDTASAFSEETDKAALSPQDLVEGLQKVANGDDTAFEDQIQYFERFGNYAKGVAKGSAQGVYDGIGLASDAVTLVMEDVEAKTEELASGLTGKDIKIDYFGDRKTKAFDKALVDATGAVYNVYEKSGANGPDESSQLKAGDVWDNPAALDDYLIQRSQALNRAVAGGTDAVVNIADNELGRITKGGETALRKSLETGGSVVGELSDVGILATVEGAKVASKLSKGLSKLDDVVDAAKATDKVADVAKTDVLSDAARTQRLEAFDTPPNVETSLTPNAGPAPAGSTRIEPVEIPKSVETNVTPSVPESAPTPKSVTPTPDAPPAANPPSKEVVAPSENPASVNAPEPSRSLDPALPPQPSNANQVANTSESALEAGKTERLETLDVPNNATTDNLPVPKANESTTVFEPLNVPGNQDTGPAKIAIADDDISTPDFLKNGIDAPASTPSKVPDASPRPGEGAPAPPSVTPDPSAPVSAANNVPAFAEPGPLPGPDFASPPKPISDFRTAETHIDPADLSPAEKWDLGTDERFNNQILSDFSSENFPKSGTIFDTSLEPGTHQLPSGSEIVLNDGQKLVLGNQIGEGGFKRVYDVPGNPKLVDKAISYPAAEFPADPRRPSLGADALDEVVYDSEVGRTILQQVEREAGEGLFSVTKRHGNPILVDDPFNAKTKVVLVREESIASPVEFIAGDGTRQTKMVTNAAERFALRNKPYATEAEQMTIQMTMRRLNDEGIVWTDNKLGNFDIVPDKDAITGHRMVFFDHDAIRIAPGASAAERAENARKTQLIMDSLEGDRQYEAYMRMSEIGVDDFNHAIFGKPMPLMATPRVNLRRTEFQRLNNLSNAEFEAELATFGEKIGKKIDLRPPRSN